MVCLLQGKDHNEQADTRACRENVEIKVMVTLKYELSESSEPAFFGAFFQFMTTASLDDAESVSMHTYPGQDGGLKILNFGCEAMASHFQAYWARRCKYLGL